MRSLAGIRRNCRPTNNYRGIEKTAVVVALNIKAQHGFGILQVPIHIFGRYSQRLCVVVVQLYSGQEQIVWKKEKEMR